MENKSNAGIIFASALVLAVCAVYALCYFLFLKELEARTYVITYSAVYGFIAVPLMYLSASALITAVLCRLCFRGGAKTAFKSLTALACLWVLVYAGAAAFHYFLSGAVGTAAAGYFALYFKHTLFIPGIILGVSNLEKKS